jgi:hypothetical protein
MKKKSAPLLLFILSLLHLPVLAGYDRHRDFPSIWATKDHGKIRTQTIEGIFTCTLNTRSTLLKKTTKTMKIGSGNICKAVTGEWKDYYTGKNITEASDIDIDHIVSVKDAWLSGAKNWSKENRANFYNDTDNLVLAGKKLNISKSDKSPSDWDFNFKSNYKRCNYLRRYVDVKMKYKLSFSEDDIEYFDDYADEDDCKLEKIFDYGTFGKDAWKHIKVRG